MQKLNHDWEKWFPFVTYQLKSKNNENMVFCFHHAGGTASTYRKWTMKKGQYNFACVELPGKGTRRKEKFITEFDLILGPLSQSIANVVGKNKFYFFGHSMGAAMAFYTADYLKKQHGIQPAKMVIAGRQAPNEENLTEFKTYMDDDALIAEMGRYQATPKEMLENKDFLSFALPQVRRDYKLNESFIYRKECLTVPLILHTATEDFQADADIMRRWEKVTTEEIKIHQFEGDHFFILNQGDNYWENLVEDLSKEQENV